VAADTVPGARETVRVWPLVIPAIELEEIVIQNGDWSEEQSDNRRTGKPLLVTDGIEAQKHTRGESDQRDPDDRFGSIAERDQASDQESGEDQYRCVSAGDRPFQILQCAIKDIPAEERNGRRD